MSQILHLKVFRSDVVRKIRLLFRLGLREAFSHIDAQAVMIITFGLVVAFAVFLIVPRDDAGLLERFSPEHVALYGIADSGPQRIAFLAFLPIVIFGGFALPLLNRMNSWTELSLKAGRLNPEWLKLHLILGFAILVAIPINSISVLRLLSSAAILALAAFLVRDSRTLWIIWAMTLALVLFVILPGWIGTPIPQSNSLFWYDIHYAALLSQGERLAAGHLLFQDTVATYGLLIPIAIGIVTHLDDAFSFGDLVRVVQGGQTLCLIAFLTAAWLRTRNSPVPGRALAIFLVALVSAPFLNSLGPAIWAPNQSGLRFLMVPVAVIVACALERRGPNGGSALVGLTIGIAILYNIETGVAITAGLGLAWLVFIRRMPWPTWVSSSGVGLVATAGVFGVVAVIYYVAFGGWPVPTGHESLRGQKLVASGFAGLPLPLRTTALLILVHSSYHVLRGLYFLVSPHGKSPSIPSTAIAGISFAWFPYWVNRPDDWNLWSYLVLYTLLLAPPIAAQGRRLVPLTVAALLVFPMSMKIDFFAPLSKERWVLGWHTGCGDGLILPPLLCSYLEERATTLQHWATEGEVIWATGLPMLTMRMTGLYGRFRSIDLFTASATATALDEILEKIQKIQPHMLLLDPPMDPILKIPPQRQKFDDRLLAAVASEDCPSQLINGWRLVEITDDCRKSCSDDSNN